jgi:hypothetical protein
MRPRTSPLFYAFIAMMMLAVWGSGSAAGQTQPSPAVCKTCIPDIAATKAAVERELQPQKELLKRLRPSQGDEIRVVERGLDVIGREVELYSNETDAQIAGYKGDAILADYLADACRSRLEMADPFIEDLGLRSNAAQRRIEVMEQTRNSPDQRERRLTELDQQRAQQFLRQATQRYDQTHPPNPNLRELSDSEKILRGEPERLKKQLDRTVEAKRSVEQLLAWDEKHGLADSVEHRFLSNELLNYNKYIESTEKFRAWEEQRKFKPKPTTFPSFADFRL